MCRKMSFGMTRKIDFRKKNCNFFTSTALLRPFYFDILQIWISYRNKGRSTVGESKYRKSRRQDFCRSTEKVDVMRTLNFGNQFFDTKFF